MPLLFKKSSRTRLKDIISPAKVEDTLRFASLNELQSIKSLLFKLINAEVAPYRLIHVTDQRSLLSQFFETTTTFEPLFVKTDKTLYSKNEFQSIRIKHLKNLGLFDITKNLERLLHQYRDTLEAYSKKITMDFQHRL